MPFNRKKNDPALDQALMDATAEGDTRRMEQLIDEGADVNAMADPTPPAQRAFSKARPVTNDNRQFILFTAALKGHKDAVRLLLDNKAKADPLTIDNRSPLMAAVSWNHLEIAEMLIDAGANMFQQAPSGAPFDRARNLAGKDDADAVRMLRMMLSKLSDRKQTELFFKYAEDCDLRVMKAFCALEGFDLRQEDTMGNTALHLVAAAGASRRDAGKVVALLLENGADVAAENHLQETALCAAMTAGPTAKEPIRLLLEAGSEIMQPTLAGITAYEAAQLAGNEEILPFFNEALKRHNSREIDKIHDGTAKDIAVKRIKLKPRKPPGQSGP
ncbi:MAG: hypothetical protein GC185_10020 [Alphaproteobacteria bacterium]|nr:hypothetical protein [Alphaproteobacteria bacterium]